jgi:GT2 family glycosyltransferase
MIVSVVVPALNAERVLPRQLEALSRQSFEDVVEVIVVDNGSKDETRSVAAEWSDRFDRLRIVDASSRPGISYARNVGVAAAGGDRVLFCDADDEADAGWVAAMCLALEDSDVVGGQLDLEALNSPVAVAWRTDPPIDGLPSTMDFLPYAIGAALGIRRSVFDDLGGFDVGFVRSHDDVEFCWRAQLAGYRLGYAEDAVMRYRLRATVRELLSQRFAYGCAYARLYAQYRWRGVKRGSMASEVRMVGEHLRRLPELRNSELAGRWFFTAGWHAGRLCGSVKHRALCP